jgi:hypothetical protein
MVIAIVEKNGPSTPRGQPREPWPRSRVCFPWLGPVTCHYGILIAAHSGRYHRVPNTLLILIVKPLRSCNWCKLSM